MCQLWTLHVVIKRVFYDYIIYAMHDLLLTDVFKIIQLIKNKQMTEKWSILFG